VLTENDKDTFISKSVNANDLSFFFSLLFVS
jgi:hypothetical protein